MKMILGQCFCLARWYSVANKEDDCREWLTKFQERDKYLHKATKSQMAYFENVKNTDWFKNLIIKAIEDSEDIYG